jgi:tRNA threonylcarbamoyl adenosine modification protein YeaZ
MSDSHLVLAVDASVRGAGMVVLADRAGAVVAQRSSLADLAGLMTAIRDLRDPPGATIGAVLVARGPGSYIGVRSGLAAGLGFAQARGLPVALVGTMEVVAARVEPRPGQLLVLASAGRGGVYGQRFELSSPLPWRPLGASLVLGAGVEWPSEWAAASWLFDPDEVGAHGRSGAEQLRATRSRAEALGLLAGVGADVGSGYDGVTADYGTRLGEHS